MYQVAAALKTFFSGFGLKAYSVDTVPDDEKLPYITYSFSQPEWNQKASGYAQVWYRSNSNEMILKKADQIVAAIGAAGRKIPLEGGYLVIWPETPQTQIMTDGDIKCAYVQFSLNAYHMPGL